MSSHPFKGRRKKTALAPSVRYIAAEWPGEVSRERQLWGELVIKKTWIVIVTIVISSRMGQKHGVMYIYMSLYGLMKPPHRIQAIQARPTRQSIYRRRKYYRCAEKRSDTVTSSLNQIPFLQCFLHVHVAKDAQPEAILGADPFLPAGFVWLIPGSVSGL